MSTLLRKEVIDFLYENCATPKYNLSLLLSAQEIPYIKGTEDEMILAYIAHIAQDGIWLGEETLLAVSEKYQVRIEIFQDCNKQIIFGDDYNWILRLYFSNNYYNTVLRSSKSTGETPVQTLPIIDKYRNVYTDSSNFRLMEELHFPSQNESETLNNNHKKIRLGTMNVRGCANLKKRENLDRLWIENELDIVAIQETNIVASEILSTNYRWFLSGNRKEITTMSRRTSNRNGVALLVRRNSNIRITRFFGISERMCYGTIYLNESKQFIVICIHVPPGLNAKRAHSFYTKLSILLNKISRNKELLIMGDFNAHIGKDQLSLDEHNLLGPNLYHAESNQIGQLMFDFINQQFLMVCTSWGRRSCLVTWHNKHTTSQLDHILMKTRSSLKIGKVCGKWSSLSDHKLILCSAWKDLRKGKPVRQVVEIQDRMGNTHDLAANMSTKQWTLDKLKDKVYLDKYQEVVKSEISQVDTKGFPSEALWRLLVHAMRHAANCHLKNALTLTPRRRKCLANYRQSIYLMRRNIIDRSVVAQNKQILNQQYNRARREQCHQFFIEIGQYKPQERMKRTFHFLKQFKRDNSQNSSVFISIGQWERELQNSHGTQVPLITENDYWPIEEPPSAEEIFDIVRGMKVGTAAGLDQIPLQLIKSLPEEGWNLLVRSLQLIWLTNSNPEEWIETVQIPLKKIPIPKTVSDFRRITITDVGYRIYAKILLNRLLKYSETLGSYQAAFLKNRSTDDHMFVVRRIMEEEWRYGRTLFVLSLDISRAFDSVDLASVTSMLKFGNIPHYLINRIVKTCLWEKTSVMWYQQRTQMKEKTIGMKQGCPLSPHLFNIVLDNVLQTLSEILPYVKLNQQEEIVLPLILAYADDIIILHTNMSQLSKIVEEIVALLESVGLTINDSKSELIIRAPLEDYQEIRELNIGGKLIKVKQTIKYLGTHISSGLSRKDTVKVRCGKALGVSKSLSLFIKKNKIPSETAIKMYKAIIAPLLTYGLKAATLTKANRLKLNRYERRILSEMLKFSSFRPIRKSVRGALSGKIITKRISVYRICYWGHVLRRNRGHLLNSVLRYTHEQKKIGRPCFTWNTSLQRDFGKFNISDQDWQLLARDKKKLKEKAETIYDLVDTSSGDSTSEDWSSENEVMLLDT